MKKLSRRVHLLFVFLVVSAITMGCAETAKGTYDTAESKTTESSAESSTESSTEAKVLQEETYATPITLSEVESYTDSAFTIISDNIPEFTEEEITTNSYESYSTLDSLGRVGVAIACVGTDLMPTEDRGDISSVYPTGWEQESYDNVDGSWLYNRSHMIGWQLTGEDANEQNLMTGTRYMNVDGMLPFENMVADYIKETGNHVMYRVTPDFDGNNLLANGVQIEAYSVEDEGEGICFNVYCYNVQPGIVIDYTTGENYASTDEPEVETEDTTVTESSVQTYILNTNTMKFHYETCSSVSTINESNKATYTGTREELIDQGYDPCGNCDP